MIKFILFLIAFYVVYRVIKGFRKHSVRHYSSSHHYHPQNHHGHDYYRNRHHSSGSFFSS